MQDKAGHTEAARAANQRARAAEDDVRQMQDKGRRRDWLEEHILTRGGASRLVQEFLAEETRSMIRRELFGEGGDEVHSDLAEEGGETHDEAGVT